MTWGMPMWLLGVPVSLVGLIWGLVYHWRRRAGGAWSGMKAVSVDGGRLREMAHGMRPPGRLIFFWLGMVFLSVALARPQIGWVELPRFEQSREVIVALDLSKSMWADDVKPSRLERSRLLVDNLLDYLKGERVGLVLFAGTAFTQSPLSADYEVLREFLPELSPEYLPQGGTNYAAMLDVVLESFSQGPGSAADRYLIILSDGESLSDEWQSRLEDLQEAGIKVIGLGVGTPAGAVIQDPAGGVIKDQSGSVVLSRLNATTLQALARGTGGEYRQADRWLDLPELLRMTIEKGRKGEFTENRDRKPMERYQVPLLIGLLFFALSFWREYPVRPRMIKGRKGEYAREMETKAATKKSTAVPPPLPASLTACWLCVLTASGQLQTPQNNQAPLVGKLSAAVSQLSQQDSLLAGDYAALAQVTVATGNELLANGTSLPRGAVEDGLDAVFAGEQQDADATDWEALRKALEELLEQTPEQKQEQQQKEQQEPHQNNSRSGDPSQSGQQEQQEQESSENTQDSENAAGGNPNQQNSEQQQERQQDSRQENQSGGEEQSSSERNQQNELGPLDGESQTEAESGKEEEQPGKSQKLQTVQGSSNEGTKTQSKDPKVVAAMKELSQVKDRDVPSELFQRMQQTPQPQQQGKDW